MNNHLFKKDTSDLSIRIIEKENIQSIDKAMWYSLGKRSRFCNPFFEPDWLISSFDHFHESNDVYIITAYQNSILVCLFPIIIKKKFGILSYIDIWVHNHCFDVNPLILKDVDFKEIMTNSCRILKCQWARIHLHDTQLISNLTYSHGRQHHYSRAYIDSTNDLTSFRSTGKFNRENQRLLKKSKEQLDVALFQYTSIEKGLKDFVRLEHKGWKGKHKGSILSLESTASFYESIIRSDWGKTSISVFGLTSKYGVIAASIRVKSNGKIFEIKTTYNEEYYNYAPGRVLEIQLLSELATHKNIQADSCTHQNNKLINRLWPNKKNLYSTVIYYSNTIAIISNILYRLKSFFR